MNTVAYSPASVTIRQQPQNYVLAIQLGSRWVVDPDSAAEWSLCVKVLRAIINGRFRTGPALVEEINSDESIRN